MKTAYSTITFRYVHDVVTGEFANIGVVLHAPEQRYLGARFSSSCDRIKRMFNQVDEIHYLAALEHLQARFSEVAANMQTTTAPIPAGWLLEIVQQVLPSDDSSLQWSSAFVGFTDDPEKTLQQVYTRLVERYAPPARNAALT
ncbi:MAG TPA: DUF3037 domain-containing protein [Verrucomicrobiae bacterium]|nr:DUF3037 domain-containing protein [Verrucomicrobiae bacterium]